MSDEALRTGDVETHREDPHTERDYRSRVAAEVRHFEGPKGFLPLSPAFHYWTNKYLRPEVARVWGIAGPVEIYAKECADAFAATGSRLALSIGSGRGDLEVQVAQRLLALGVRDFRIDCIELAPRLCEAGRSLAAQRGVGAQIGFLQADMNAWAPAQPGGYAAIIANEILHHVVELESLFASLKRALARGGKLVTRDMIGRNGHRCWPEAKAVVDRIWKALPKRFTWDHRFGGFCEVYPDRDFSSEGFEGIRSQDILPLLLESFAFERFVAFGGLIERFTGRAFGRNFRVEEEEGDRTLVDLLYVANEVLIDAGAMKPTQMIATLSTEPVTPACGFGWRPEWCLRRPGD